MLRVKIQLGNFHFDLLTILVVKLLLLILCSHFLVTLVILSCQIPQPFLLIWIPELRGHKRRARHPTRDLIQRRELKFQTLLRLLSNCTVENSERWRTPHVLRHLPSSHDPLHQRLHIFG